MNLLCKVRQGRTTSVIGNFALLGSNGFFLAKINHSDQKHSGEKRAYLTYTFRSQFIIKGNQGSNFRQNPAVDTMKEACFRVTRQLMLHQISQKDPITYLGMAPLILCCALSPSVGNQDHPPRHFYRPFLIQAIPRWRFFSHITLECVNVGIKTNQNNWHIPSGQVFLK